MQRSQKRGGNCVQRKESLRTGLWSREDAMVSADRVVPMPWVLFLLTRDEDVVGKGRRRGNSPSMELYVE